MIELKKVAIVGAGVSGLTCARLIKDKYDVTVFEKEDRPGGLIKCSWVGGSLFHTCGGHVFNSKRQDVLDWFWSHFDRDECFLKAIRNSVVFMENGKEIPYPIENHMYLFDENIQKRFISDLMLMMKQEGRASRNFEEFLTGRFGDTLYQMYFQPYNEKVWQRDLTKVPLEWLEGKLPMPTVAEMIYNNMNRIEERAFVHSSFWYEKKNGSQFVADRFAQGLNIRYNTAVDCICYENGKWIILGQTYDRVVFCGNIKDLMLMIKGVDVDRYVQDVMRFEYHGTTSVFCEIDRNPYSWIYLPSHKYKSHRIICTGNFSDSNNNSSLPKDRITATIEFTDEIDKDSILNELLKMPLHPLYLGHKFNKYTYPIQNATTRDIIQSLKDQLVSIGFYFTGRFADWEYYNMDAAIGAAMKTIVSMIYM